MYETLKWVHVGCAIARGALMLIDSPLLVARFDRVAPHEVDTALAI